MHSSALTAAGKYCICHTQVRRARVKVYKNRSSQPNYGINYSMRFTNALIQQNHVRTKPTKNHVNFFSGTRGEAYVHIRGT
jgi:hypothetical protein